MFFDIFGLARTCSDLFGSIWMRPDASGCVQKRPEAFRHFRKISFFFYRSKIYLFRNFGKVLEELEANGPQNQLPRQILL